MSFHAVIPAGGAGTRLWPVSRQGRPKFLLDLTGDGRSLLQLTWDRLAPIVGADHVHVVTGARHAAAIAEQLPELQHLVVEPSPHDSMPAIGLAAALIEETDPGAVIGSFAADHVVGDDAVFAAALREAVAVAESGKVCTIGIAPTEASTAFGYIESGASLGLDAAPHALAVERFVEKPDADTAADYLAAGAYRWNAGMFVVSAEILLGHLADLQPDLYDGLTTIARAMTHGGATEVPVDVWDTLPTIAIDHAIAEPVAAQGGVATVPGEFGWTDIGDFDALADDAGERLAADPDVLWIDADGIALSTPGKTITVIGIPDAVVIETDDALLVTTRAHAQRVKEAPAAWRDRGRPDLT